MATTEADLVLLVLDRSQPLTQEDRELSQAYPEALCLVNKVDLPSAWPGESDQPCRQGEFKQEEFAPETDAGLRRKNAVLHRLGDKCVAG